jgi:hypothetical protein
MSNYNPNIPQPTDRLNVSQTQLLQNFGQLDTSFGIDHYKFSDLTANNGFHNQVTTPGYVANPPTGLPPVTTNNPVMYGFQVTAPLGILQFSRGPNNAVPTPITQIHSTAAATVIGATTTINILDFTGIPFAIALAAATNTTSPLGLSRLFMIVWTGAAFFITQLSPQGSVFFFTSSGSTLQLSNTGNTPLNNVYWSLDFLRIG